MSKEWSNLAKVVYRRTYSRNDLGFQENWSDTVERVITGNVKGLNVSEQEINRLRYFMMERKATPAGRGLWYSGAPSHQKLGGAALNNCFAGEEKFVTKEKGAVSFSSVVGETLTVWDGESWQTAEVKSFGTQQVQRVVFAPCAESGKGTHSNHSVAVVVTPDHAWFLKDGSRTTSLSVGDVVPASKVQWSDIDEGGVYRSGLIHGWVFGDGTVANRRKDGTYRYHIRLCGACAKAVISIFDDVTYPPTYNGDAVGRCESMENLKEFPTCDKSAEYIKGFVDGWMGADGNWTSSTPRLSSQHPNAKQWLLDNAAVAGFVLTGFSKHPDLTNFGKRKNELYTYTLAENKRMWRVKSVESLGVREVFCVSVPTTGKFTLASGIQTSNCWALTAEDWTHFVVAQDLLMLGGGVGLSVEHRFVSKLPRVKREVLVTHIATKDADFIVPDNREGWNELLRRTLEAFFVTGKSFTYSTVCVRPEGEPIRGFGGTASGPRPLINMIATICNILAPRAGKSVRPLDAADILCSIGQMVVAGNVRRSAIIILGDPWDKDYLKAKRWSLGNIPNYRAMANFSVVVDDVEDLHPNFWKTYEDGEPFGILNRTNVQKYGRMGEEKYDPGYLTNPCAEATLENGEPCNLQEIALCNLNDLEELKEAARLMHRYGKRVTMEKYHQPLADAVVKKNRRVGTGITGCLSSPLFTPDALDAAYAAIQEENVAYSKELNIPVSVRTTVVKPSGSMSKLMDTEQEEGIHGAFSEYMIQRIRFASSDKDIAALRAAGHYMEPVVRFDGTLDHGTQVVDFYAKAPEGALIAGKTLDTWKQLDVVKMAQKHWADQSVSVTVYYKRSEIPEIKEWLRNNLQYIKSVSFLLQEDHGFKQAPKEAITKEQYEKLSVKVRPLDEALLSGGEMVDGLECAGGACPIR